MLGVVLGGFIAQRWGWQAGRLSRRSGSRARVALSADRARDYKTVVLPRRWTTPAAQHRLSARAVIAELLRPRTAIMTCFGAGLSLLVFSTTYAWLPSYLTRYYGSCAGSRRTHDRRVSFCSAGWAHW